ncbi:MAG TPA: ABC transporter permease [Thermoanaerobaculia bacterium]|nr:ABC transporter permease [Thermoanaerobaculia bacterium]
MKLAKVRAIAVKEYRQAARDPLTLGMLLGLPTMMLLLYGYAVNFDVRHIRLAIEDRDKSAASRDLASAFVNSGYFDLVANLPAGSDLARLTERRGAAAILIVPESYGRDVAAGRTARVQMVLDGADANTATTVLGYAEAVAGEASVAVVRAAGASRGAGAPGGTAAAAVAAAPIDYEPRVWYNPELKTTQFLVPGLIGFILMLTAVLSTAMSVVREKERGTMEQLRVSSLSPGELLVGKTVPYLSISLAATVIILLAARILFGVVVRGSYFDLFVITFIYLVGALGFGLLVSSIADSQAMAFQIGAGTSMLPAILLSGFIFPIRSMPIAVQVITYAVPARYFLVVLRGVILKGAGLAPYGRDIAFLLAYAVAVLGLAFVRLARKEV